MARTKTPIFKSPIFLTLLGALFILVIVILFLPQLISTSFVSSKVKETINEKAPGIVDYEKMQLSWLSGLQLTKLQYSDESLGVELNVDEVTTSKGLLALATNYKDGGTIEITRPRLRVLVKDESNAEGTSQKDQSATQAKTTKSEERETEDTVSEELGQELPSLPPINVELQVTDGSLVAVEEDGKEKNIIEKLQLFLDLGGPAGTAEYKLSLNNGQNDGVVQGEGNLALGDENPGDINNIQSKAQIEIVDWQISDLLSLAAARSNAPEGSGIIRGTVQISSQGLANADIKGQISGEGIELYGGPLKSDTPQIDSFVINLAAVKAKQLLEFESLKIQSPFLTADINAKVHNKDLQSLTSSTEINIAEIFSQLPATLQLQQGLELTRGMLELDAMVQGIKDSTRFDAQANLKDLAGTANGKKVSLNQPVDITVKGVEKNGDINLDTLTIASSFLTADGKGNMDAMTLNLKANIGDALAELKQFIDLDQLSSNGELALKMNIESATKTVRKVTGDLLVKGFELKDGKTTISPKNNLSLNFASKLQLEKNSALKEIGGSKLQFKSWLGDGSVTFDSLVPPQSDKAAVLNNGKIQGKFDLVPITTLLHSLEKLPKEQEFSGTVELQTELSGKNLDHPTVAMKLGITPFTFQQGDKSFSDEKLIIEIEANTDLQKKNYSFKKLGISTKPLQLAGAAYLMSANNDQSLELVGTSSIDLNELSKLLQNFLDLQLTMSGVSKTPIKLKSSTSEGKWKDIGKRSELSTSLQAKSIIGYGLNIESLTLPVQLEQAVGEIDLQAKVNRGTMNLKPKVDFTGKYPVATLPENSAILKEVGLTGDMSNDLLSKIHPLFKGVAKTDGTINLDMGHFHWPAGEGQKKEVNFSGSITFNEAQLQAGALLTPLLELLKEDERSIVLSDTPMTFVGKDERVTCSPLEATVNEYSLFLEGSVGFDQSLDYVARVPVTRKMVSSKIYKYLEGTYINVPITGTASKPQISKSVLQDALSDLVLQAGKKQLNEQAGKLLESLFN